MLFCVFALNTQAQEEAKTKFEHNFTRLGIEVRADFDYENYQTNTDIYTLLGTIHSDSTANNYGFNGKDRKSVV